MKLPTTLPSLKSLKIKWLIFPAISLTFFVFTTQRIFLGPFSLWSRLMEINQEVNQNLQQAEALSTKLSLLQRANNEQDTETLAKLVGVFPATNPLTVAISELETAAGATGTNLVSYQSVGVGGTGILATYTVGDVSSVSQLVTYLHNSLPLLAVKNLAYEAGNLTMSVQTYWEPYVALSANPEETLPDYSSSAATVLQAVSSYHQTAVSDPVTPTLPVSSNPF